MAEIQKGYHDIIEDKTGIYKHREWRGVEDTLYDYSKWLELWGILLKWALGHPVTNVKAIFRYRWMVTYLATPSFYDRIMSQLTGPALKAARMNMNTLAKTLTEELDYLLAADAHLHQNSEAAKAKAAEKAKKIIYIDELVPKIITAGFKDHHTILAQMVPSYLPSLINQHSPVHYIETSESYSLPADVCPLTATEAGIAIDDDYPLVGCCFVSSNMPCDGSIMTTTIQDRRFNLPTYAFNIPLRWTREDTQEYAVEELKACIAFMEEHTGEKYDWDRLKDACEIWNEQTKCKMEKWEMNKTDTPPHTGSTTWLYRIFSYQCACGDRRILENDKKVNEILRKSLGHRTYPKVTRHRAVLWNTPANMYANFNNWLSDCWGIESVCDMIDYQGSEIIDTSSKETMLAGIAKMAQGATMRVHTKGGCHVILDDLWLKVEEYNADMVVMFDQISCKGVTTIRGLFEEQARARGIKMVWVEQDLFDPTTISRRHMRDTVNKYMEAVMGEKPVDPTLLDFDDSESW